MYRLCLCHDRIGNLTQVVDRRRGPRVFDMICLRYQLAGELDELDNIASETNGNQCLHGGFALVRSVESKMDVQQE